MDGVIDKYLMTKFSEGLRKNFKIPCSSQFQDLEALLNQIRESPSPTAKVSLREKLYYLNNVLTECQTLSRKRTIYTADELYSIYSIRRKLNKMIAVLADLSKVKADVNSMTASTANNVVNPQENGETSLSDDGEIPQSSSLAEDHASEVEVYGFDHEILSLEKLLLRRGGDDQFKAIGIVGMGGIGKSTLCRVLFNKQEIKNWFLPRIWVSMSTPVNNEDDPKTALVKRMLDALGVEEEIMDSISSHRLPGLICALHLQLIGKRYLIVLDGATEKDDWYSKLSLQMSRDGKWDDFLAYGLPKGHDGTVIVTSRNEELAKKMVGEENIHRLLPFSDTECCWSIFRDAVGIDNIMSNTSNVEDLKRKIKQKCAGVPLAAKIMGEIMNEQLKAREAVPFEDNENDIQEI